MLLPASSSATNSAQLAFSSVVCAFIMYGIFLLFTHVLSFVTGVAGGGGGDYLVNLGTD